MSYPHHSDRKVEAQLRYARLEGRLIRNARRAVRSNGNTLALLCERWGDRRTVRAAERFSRDAQSERPVPQRWPLEEIVSALSNGACDVDLSARRIAGALRTLAADLDELADTARMLETKTP